MLLNLISNAIKFSKSGGSVSIICKKVINALDLTYDEPEMKEIVSKSSDGMIEIIVRDTGVGIKEENLQKLFKLFGFLEATKELNTNGIGLGLHICKMIVE